ncbi:MAG: AAA family ATPase [Phaeodactylibacter sp.]|nr:AAA family ATPase [Phaeodactylibacter sp.]
MKKRFNITGVCIADRHYMMDTREKINAVMEMIDYGEYFVINRPRQYGKTTMIFLLEDYLKKKGGYLAIKTSFEEIGDLAFENEQTLSRSFLGLLHDAIVWENPDFARFFQDKIAEARHLTDLSKIISQVVREAQKKVVLLIDEVDASSNNPMFLKLLSMLRSKYLNRHRKGQETFHSVILAGVHDVKTLKLKLRSDGQHQYNSPWNIAADFNVDMSFNPKEIAPMLEEYAWAESIEMDIPAIAERLYYYTSGYPFLVSKLCKVIAEKLLPANKGKTWTTKDVDIAVNVLLAESNTNFDSLVKNLENNQDLHELVFAILVQGKFFSFNIHNPVIQMGVMYGILKNGAGTKIHNRIYEQLIYNYMVSKMETHLTLEDEGNRLEVIQNNNELNLEKILLKFQRFMQEQYRKKDQAFLEREGRLIFLAYLHPILNGGGHTFVEAQISEEKRLDVVVTYFQNQYIVELKRWYGEKKHQAGLNQLSDYLSRQNQQQGYLVIFEHNKKKSWRKERIRHTGKDIYAVWV